MKSFHVLVGYYLLSLLTVAEFQQENYYKFIKEDLMAGEPESEVSDYINFKYAYNNLLI